MQRPVVLLVLLTLIFALVAVPAWAVPPSIASGHGTAAEPGDYRIEVTFSAQSTGIESARGNVRFSDTSGLSFTGDVMRYVRGEGGAFAMFGIVTGGTTGSSHFSLIVADQGRNDAPDGLGYALFDAAPALDYWQSVPTQFPYEVIRGNFVVK